MILSLVFSLWLFVSCSYGTEYSNSTSFAGGNYTVRWKFDNETEMFYFKVDVKATGWIGFGISRLLYPRIESLQWNFKSMQYYDVIVGGQLENGTSYHEDYLTNGHVVPVADKQQDWTVTNIAENGGVTTMEFHRKKDTGDRDDDNVIGPGARRMVWAYHDTLDTMSNVTKHTHEGFEDIDFLKQPRLEPEMRAYRSDRPTTGASTIATSIIGNFLLFIIAVIFFY